jgi:hypothetical protein
MRYEHPCRESQFRQWRTDIGLLQLEQNRFRFSLEVHHWLLPNYIGEEPTKPLPTAPGVVRRLVDSDRWKALAGSEELWPTERKIEIGQGKLIVQRLEDPARECPLIWITCSPEGGPASDPVALGRLLCGTARVYYSADREVDQELNALVPPGLGVRGGSIRVYQPRLRLGQAADYKRHRFITKTQIDELGVAAVNEMIVRGLARRSRASAVDAVISIDDVGRRRREARIAELKAHAAQNPSEWTQLLEAENTALSRQLADFHQEREGWTEEIEAKDSEIHDLQDDLDTKAAAAVYHRSQAEELRVEVGTLQQRLTNFEKLSSLPGDLATVLQVMSDLYPERLVVHPDAVASAAESSFTDTPVAWEILWGAATVLHDLLFSEKKLSLQEIEQEFRTKVGYDLSFTEGTATKADRKLMRLRKIEYEGKDLEITPHIKYGVRPPKCLRVHFAVDNANTRLVIGHCGDHMPTAGTRRRN